ncbi:MAG: hypothetical protein Q9207_007960 [Kuettlingeria erythrocarpa]
MAREDFIEPNENIVDLTNEDGTPNNEETAEEETNEEETAEDKSARSLQAILNQTPAGYSPQHGLRQVLSLPEVQDRAFGIDSPGGLTRDDYNNLTTIIGPVLDEQGKSTETLERIFPVDCDEMLPHDSEGNSEDNSEDDIACPGQEGLRRCVGYYADPGHVAGQPNPSFDNQVQQGRIRLHYVDEEQDVLQKWTAPTVHQAHGAPQHQICQNCWLSHGRQRVRDCNSDWRGNVDPPIHQRWFRLCKKHSTLARSLDMDERNEDFTPNCNCMKSVRLERRCGQCHQESIITWDQRAQHWRNELLHTYRKRGKYQRPFVDLSKQAKVRPVCAWKGCGRPAWYHQPRSVKPANLEKSSDRLGLSDSAM